MHQGVFACVNPMRSVALLSSKDEETEAKVTFSGLAGKWQTWDLNPDCSPGIAPTVSEPRFAHLRNER